MAGGSACECIAVHTIALISNCMMLDAISRAEGMRMSTAAV